MLTHFFLSFLNSKDDFDKLLRTPQRITVGEEQKGQSFESKKKCTLWMSVQNQKPSYQKTLANGAFLERKNQCFRDLRIIQWNPTLSKNARKPVSKLLQAKEEQLPITAVVGTNNGGFILSSEDMRDSVQKAKSIFTRIPPEQYLQKTYTFIITDVQKNRFVASRKSS